MPGDKKYYVKVERKTLDVFRVEARNANEAFAKVYMALAEDENGDGVMVVNIEHTITKQEVKQPRVANGDDETLPGLG